MLRKISTLLAAVLALGMMFGSTADASAHGRRYGCCGGTVAPTVKVRTVYRHKTYTVVHTVHRTRYVPREHDVIHVTRIQPIIDVHHIRHVVTDVYPKVYTVNKHRTVYLSAQTGDFYTTTYATRCGCRLRH